MCWAQRLGQIILASRVAQNGAPRPVIEGQVYPIKSSDPMVQATYARPNFTPAGSAPSATTAILQPSNIVPAQSKSLFGKI